MMKSSFWLLGSAIIFATFFCMPTFSQNNEDVGTVQYLYNSCKQDINTFGRTYCLGYIQSAGDLLLLNSEAPNADLSVIPSICPEKDEMPTVGAEVQSFVNWAEKHPERWSKPAMYGVAMALPDSWPCHKSN